MKDCTRTKNIYTNNSTQWLGGVMVRTYDQEVMGLTPGQVVTT